MSGLNDSAIVSEMNQLKCIDLEIKRLNAKIKELKQGKKQMETRIMNYLERAQMNGAKTSDMVVLAREKTVNTKKKKDEKVEDIASILKSAGVVSNVNDTVNKVLEALKGDETIKKTLIVKSKQQFSKKK
jgi:hypothetical protein